MHSRMKTHGFFGTVTQNDRKTKFWVLFTENTMNVHITTLFIACTYNLDFNSYKQINVPFILSEGGTSIYSKSEYSI